MPRPARLAQAAAEAAAAAGAAAVPKPAAPKAATPVAFLFPGQGSQAVGMLKASQLEGGWLGHVDSLDGY